MTLLIFCMSLFSFIITFTLFYKPAKNSDIKQRRLNVISGNKLELDDDLEKPFIQRFLVPVFANTMKRLSRLMPKNKGDKTQKVQKNLKLAGINLSPSEYNAARLMFFFGLIISVIAIVSFFRIDIKIKVLLVTFSVVISFIVPVYYMKFKVNNRQGQIRDQLPDVMDLLSVSIEAGLGFDSALVKIGEGLNGALVEELNTVLMEIRLGRPRRDALRSLSERTVVDELSTFISSIIQAEQLGIPIKNVLHTQAHQVRTMRRQRAEEKAMKAPVKMMIPLVVFVFPVLFIILLGPTILQIIKQFT